MDLLTFLSDVFNSWVEKVGIILTIFPFIEKIPRVRKWLDDKPLIDHFTPLIWLLGGACIFSGFYSAWQIQYHKANTATDSLKELTVPELILAVDELGVGRKPGKLQIPVIFVIASISNKGAPSIAESWDLHVTLPDGRTTDAGTDYMDPTGAITVDDPNGGSYKYKYAMADALYTKASKPIERGYKIRGLLLFTLPAFTHDEAGQTGTKFVLKCQDVNGKEANVDFAFTRKGDKPNYYPGLSPVPR